jgi:hypothetical protein
VNLSHCSRAAEEVRRAKALATSQFTIGRASLLAAGGSVETEAYIES